MRKPTLILLALLTCLIPASSFAITPEIAAGRYDKIIVVIGENLGYENLFNGPNDPCPGASDLAGYIQTLAGLALNYTAAHSSTHPSLPNYLRLFAGMDNGITEDGCVCDASPPTCTPGSGSNPCDHSCIACGGSNQESVISAMTLYGELKNDGVPGTNFVLWAEGLLDNNTDKFICSNADYVQKHNPAAFFANSRNDECNVSVWTGWTQNTMPPPPDRLLPTVNGVAKGVAFVIPGQDHNGHNGASTQARVQAWNTWLQGNIPQYVNYALTPANNTLLIITQDEKSGGYCGDLNHIILFFIAGDLQAQTDSTCVGRDTCPGVAPGQAAQYNILKTITKNFNLANLNNAGTGVSALIPPL